MSPAGVFPMALGIIFRHKQYSLLGAFNMTSHSQFQLHLIYKRQGFNLHIFVELLKSFWINILRVISTSSVLIAKFNSRLIINSDRPFDCPYHLHGHFIAHKRSCGKVMFLHLSVTLSGGGRVKCHIPPGPDPHLGPDTPFGTKHHPLGPTPSGTRPPLWDQTGSDIMPLPERPWTKQEVTSYPQTTKVGSTHPTGMLSCFTTQFCS